jgi:hypothetical protein
VKKEIPVRWNILCLDAFGETNAAFIVVVKKTARYSNVFFYNHLYRNSAIRNIIMKSGAMSGYPSIDLNVNFMTSTKNE